MGNIKSRKQEIELHRSEPGPASPACLTPLWKSIAGTRNLRTVSAGTEVQVSDWTDARCYSVFRIQT